MDARLQKLVEASENIVFFGGAGVSCESGIPDFRGTDGLYHQTYRFPPEEILSHHFFEERPEEFFRFYRDKMLYPDAKPNAAHRALARWEREGRLRAVVTQNIDGLHQAAGSKNVLELHGSVHRNHCVRCGAFYSLADLLRTDVVPRCACGGVIKPDVVLYEEPLDDATVDAAVQAIRAADLLIVGGTSLNVYPAAGLLRFFSGGALVFINKTPTPADRSADLIIQDAIGKVMGEL